MREIKALPGRLYALILDARVRWIFTADDLPQWNDEQHPSVDITDVVPAPKVGWICSKGAFFPEPGPAPDEFHALDAGTFTWKPLAAQDSDAKKTAAANVALRSAEIETMFEILFQLASDVRALKGQQPMIPSQTSIAGALTREQLRDQMIAFYKTRI